jgi:anti-anti-sigma factor
MSTQPDRKALIVEQVGEVTLIRLQRRLLLESETIEAVAKHLSGLVEKGGHSRLLINFGCVERLSSDMLGKLITVHRKTMAAGGRLAICQVHPEIRKVFDLINLSKLLHIYDDEETALRSF